MKDSIRRFIRFLKENNVYTLYIDELNRYKSRMDNNFKAISFLNYIEPRCYLSSAFVWNDVNGDSGFWYRYHQKWERELGCYDI